MPQNCSADIQAVMEYLDQNYAENNTAVLQGLKEAFGLGSLAHIDDFAAARGSRVYFIRAKLIPITCQSSAE